jgi:putative aldouronate transport system permease protein
MTKNTSVATLANRRKTPLQRFLTSFKKNWQLHLMMLLPLAYILIFNYGPMYGLQIAFRDFRIRRGIWGSEWVGLEHFYDFFGNIRWKQIVGNTLRLSLYSIVAGFPVPIILALILHINKNGPLKKFTQNVSYIPHFISTVVMVMILDQIFSPYNGLVAAVNNQFGIRLFGGTNVMEDPDTFDHVFVWSDVWQSMGWGAIMYVAALSGVSPELHEAAKIDGASRFRRIFAVDLPAIMPTICIMLIMRFGSVMSVGYEKIYLMYGDLNATRAQVISLYVYKQGLQENNLSFATAVGLMNSVINTVLIVTVNWITNKISDGEQGLF